MFIICCGLTLAKKDATEYMIRKVKSAEYTAVRAA
jgi:hypothetical protein